MYITDMSVFYVLTGQVTYRMTYNQSPHIRVRSGIYHFVRRVPADLQQHYRSDRVSISLRTKSATEQHLVLLCPSARGLMITGMG